MCEKGGREANYYYERELLAMGCSLCVVTCVCVCECRDANGCEGSRGKLRHLEGSKGAIDNVKEGRE
jgi:hypothetical protein